MIAGVNVKRFSDLANDQGAVQHMLRADDKDFFSGFGEIYFSITNPGVIKGWHVQSEQTNVLSCVHGELKLVLCDLRPTSSTKGVIEEILFGDGNRALVLIPPGITYGWKNIGGVPAILANCANRTHTPATSKKLPLSEVPYVW